MIKKLALTGVVVAFASTAASAADLPRRAEPPLLAPAPLFTWTGVYIGSHTTYTFSDTQRITTIGNDPVTVGLIGSGVIPATVSNKQDRLAKFGGGFGFNYQFTPGSGFVVGASVDVDWTDLHKNTLVVGNPVGGVSVATAYFQSLNYLGTANGRIGYAFDRFLVYATGGVAFGSVDYTVNAFTPGPVRLFTGGAQGSFETGLNYGGGIEYAIPNDSILGKFDLLELVGIKLGGSSTLRAEYIRYDLGSRNVLVADTLGFGATATARFRTEGSMIRAGFTYKFP